MSEYLAIKNWQQFQSSRRHFDWIKDYPAQVSDEDYCKLTFFQRHVLQELRRLRGRIGKNIPYDLRYICRETAATVPDKPRINAALTRLLHDGWLVLTNQQVDFEQKEQIKKEIEKEKEKKPSAPATPRGARPAPAKVSNALGETKHSRIQGMVSAAYREANGVDPPWDGSEAGQLGRLIRATPRWDDQLYAQCLTNMYRSEGFPPGTRPREFLPWLPKCLNGPLDRFKNAKGAGNGHGTHKTAAAGRATRNVAALVQSSVGAGVQRVHVSDGGTIQPGADDRRSGRPARAIADGSIVEGKPAGSKPAPDA